MCYSENTFYFYFHFYFYFYYYSHLAGDRPGTAPGPLFLKRKFYVSEFYISVQKVLVLPRFLGALSRKCGLQQVFAGFACKPLISLPQSRRCRLSESPQWASPPEPKVPFVGESPVGKSPRAEGSVCRRVPSGQVSQRPLPVIFIFSYFCAREPRRRRRH